MMKTIALAFLLSLPLMAQDAVVVVLDAKDGADSARLYQAKQDADKAWQVQQEKMAIKYAKALIAKNQCDASASLCLQGAGVSSGFVFSADFRFIVPAPTPTFKATSGCSYFTPTYNGVITTDTFDLMGRPVTKP